MMEVNLFSPRRKQFPIERRPPLTGAALRRFQIFYGLLAVAFLTFVAYGVVAGYLEAQNPPQPGQIAFGPDFMAIRQQDQKMLSEELLRGGAR